MVDITHKIKTLRTAVAESTVKVSHPDTMAAIKNQTVPKGNVLEMAKTAGLFAVKNTHHSIPDCHPLPIEFTSITYELHELEIKIKITVKTIYKTGVEVEAMHAASIVALTMYDMLKPIDKGIEIQQIRLVSKHGGKSDFLKFPSKLSASVIVCSDSISQGKKHDQAGKKIIEKLEKNQITIDHYQIIPDEIEDIQQEVWKHANNSHLILFTGGTGLSYRDVTPQALEPLLERRIPGIEEAIRSYGQERTPYSMLSRSVAGTIGNSLVIALPGSTKGAEESMDAIFPHILHIFNILRGAQHD